VTLRNWLIGSQMFEQLSVFILRGRNVQEDIRERFFLDISTPEDKDITLPRNVGIQLASDTASYPRKNGSSATPLRNPRNSQLWKVWKTAVVPYLIVFRRHLCGKRGKSRTLPFSISSKPLDIVNVCCPNANGTTYLLICINLAVL
jgi:hypothetical protein